jgi:hypothetical protein
MPENSGGRPRISRRRAVCLTTAGKILIGKRQRPSKISVVPVELSIRSHRALSTLAPEPPVSVGRLEESDRSFQAQSSIALIVAIDGLDVEKKYEALSLEYSDRTPFVSLWTFPS